MKVPICFDVNTNLETSQKSCGTLQRLAQADDPQVRQEPRRPGRRLRGKPRFGAQIRNPKINFSI